MIKRLVFLGCILIVSLCTLRSFFSPGFFPMHDDAQVARVIVMSRALRNGQFPVRLVEGLGYGYGYPLFNFYGPLPYYIGGFAVLLGMDVLMATKVMIAIGVVMGSIGMYFLSSSVFGTYGGILSAVMFSYFPYRAVQIFVRGAIGEMWAVTCMPWVCLGLLHIFRNYHRKTAICLTSVSLAGIILSHTVFGYITMGCIISGIVLILLIGTVQKKKYFIRRHFLSLAAACVLALGMTAFFWLPAYSEMQYTNVQKVIGSTASYTDHFICLSQLWNSQWGFGGSASGCIDGMSFKLGKFQIMLVCASVILWLVVKEKNKQLNYVMICALLLTCVSLILTLQISEPVWNTLPLFSYIQYPWRFLGPLGVGIAFISGYLLYRTPRTASLVGLATIGIIIFFINDKLFTPQYLYYRPVLDYGIPEEIQFRASKVSDEYLPKGIHIPADISEALEPRIQGNDFMNVKTIWETETGGEYEVLSDTNGELKLRMAYFPGWKFYINNLEVNPKVVEGEPSVVLSAGYSILKVRFSDTPVRRIGDAISGFSIIGLIILILYGNKAVSNHRHTRLQ